MPGNQITFGVGFNVNEAGLNKLKQSLQEIQKVTAKDFSVMSGLKGQQAVQELNKVKTAAQEVERALNEAFNPRLGTTSITKFSQAMQNINISNFAMRMNQMGVDGQKTFLNLAQQALALNTPLKQNVGWLTKIGTTLANSIKWNIASSTINAFTGSIQSAFNYVKALDASLTDIRIVTGQSREEMALFAQQANDAAQALGRQTKEYTNAALAFYQQGLSADEVQARTETSLKAQNVTGAGTEIVDQLTAVWNGYNATIEETESYVDKLAAVADSSATNLSELATGMSKVASTANNMGVTMDQLTAQLATIIATTRQAPETVGNALKTIYARINDIKSGSDEAEISLGNYTSKMASLGINVLDADGKLKDTGQTMEEIGARWATMTREQQIYLAQTMAGQRQMNNLIALFDNWQKYSDMLNVSLGSQGALNEKNARYMESLSAHINQFKATVEGMQDALINEDDISRLYDTGSKLVDLFTSFIHSMGGMRGVIAALGVLGTSIFKNQIAESILVASNNLQVFNEKLQQAAAREKVISLFDTSKMNFDNPAFESAIQRLQGMALEANNYRSAMTAANQETLAGLLEQQAALDGTALELQDLVQKSIEYANQAVAFSNFYGDGMGGEDFKFEDIFTKFDMANQEIELNEKNVESLRQSLVYTREEYSFFGKTIQEVITTSRAQRDQILEVAAQYKEQEAKVKALQTSYENLSVAQKMAQQSQYQQELQRENDALEQLKQQYESLNPALYKMKEELKALTSDETKFGENTSTITALLEKLGTIGNDDVRTLSALLAVMEKGQTDTANLEQRIRSLIDTVAQFKNGVNQGKTAWDQFLKTLESQTLAQSLTKLLQGISSLAMAWQSLASVQKTYEEMQKGTIDKLEGTRRIIMSVSMALPMLISGFKNLGTGLLALPSAIGNFNKALGDIVINASSGSTVLSGLIGKLGGAAAAAKVGAAAFGAVAAVIAVIIGAGVLLYRHLNKTEIAMRDAAKAAQEAQEEYQKVKEKYEELQSSIEDYTKARAAIDELVAGTQEWRDAIEQANEQALNLLDIYPELSKFLKRDQNGAYYFDEEGLNEFQADRRKALQQEKIESTSATLKSTLTTKDQALKDEYGINDYKIALQMLEDYGDHQGAISEMIDALLEANVGYYEEQYNHLQNDLSTLNIQETQTRTQIFEKMEQFGLGEEFNEAYNQYVENYADIWSSLDTSLENTLNQLQAEQTANSDLLAEKQKQLNDLQAQDEEALAEFERLSKIRESLAGRNLLLDDHIVQGYGANGLWNDITEYYTALQDLIELDYENFVTARETAWSWSEFRLKTTTTTASSREDAQQALQPLTELREEIQARINEGVPVEELNKEIMKLYYDIFEMYNNQIHNQSFEKAAGKIIEGEFNPEEVIANIETQIDELIAAGEETEESIAKLQELKEKLAEFNFEDPSSVDLQSFQAFVQENLSDYITDNMLDSFGTMEEMNHKVIGDLATLFHDNIIRGLDEGISEDVIEEFIDQNFDLSNAANPKRVKAAIVQLFHDKVFMSFIDMAQDTQKEIWGQFEALALDITNLESWNEDQKGEKDAVAAAIARYMYDQVVNNNIDIDELIADSDAILADQTDLVHKVAEVLPDAPFEAIANIFRLINTSYSDWANNSLMSYEEVLKLLQDDSVKDILEGHGIDVDASAARVEEGKQIVEDVVIESLKKQFGSFYDALFSESVLEKGLVADVQLVPLVQKLAEKFKTTGKAGINAFDELFEELEGKDWDANKIYDFANLLLTLDFNTPAEEILQAAEEAGFASDDLSEKILALAAAAVGASEQIQASSLMNINNDYQRIMKEVGNLDKGESLSNNKDYNDTVAYLKKVLGDRFSEFFAYGKDGIFVLQQDAEKLFAAIDDFHRKNLESYLEENAARQAFLQQLKQDQEGQLINNLNVKDQYDLLSNFIKNEDNTLGGQLPRGQENLDELFMRAQSSDNNIEASAAIAKINELFQNYIKNINITPELETLIADAAQAKAQLAAIASDSAVSMHELDEDVDVDQWQELTAVLYDYANTLDGVSDEVYHNKELSEELAEEILRFSSALDEAEDNMEEWQDALSSNSVTKHIKAIQQLRNVYGDLLDLDSRSLSQGFLDSAENLERLNKILYGTEEEANQAYNELQQLANADIEAQIIASVDPDSRAQVEQYFTDLHNVIDENTLNVEIGAEINGEEDVINALNNIIAAAHMTQYQADALIGSLGMNAEYDDHPETTTVTYPGGYNAKEGTPVTASFSIPMGFGSFFAGMADGTINVPSVIYEQADPIEEEQTISVPTVHVNNLTKSAGGDYKRASTGGSRGSGGSGGKKGGGGGGGNKAPKKKDPIKKFKSKIDPYHDVNIKIGNVQEGLDKLDKSRNKLIGKEAIDNLTKQINLMEKEKKLLQEKDKIAQKEQQRLANELATLGVIFNKNGDIANYKKILTREQNKINKAIEIANGLEGEEREAYEKYINDLKEQYQELEDKIKEYDETVQLRDDLRAQYQDLIDQQIELAIEAFDLEINVKLDLKDAEKDFNEFRKKVVDKLKDDDFAGQAEATAREYATYYNVDENGDAGGLINDLRSHEKRIQQEIEIIKNGGFSQIYGDNLAAAAEDLKKYNDELMQALEEAQEIIDETHDHFLEAIDAMNDAFDTQQDNFDRLDDLLTHDMEILQLVHGEENYDEMDRLWNQQIDQDNRRLAALQTEQEYWKDRLNDYEEGTDEWKKAMENWQDTFEKTNDAMMTAVQNLQTKWENSINSIMSKLRNDTFGGNLDAALEDWDKMTWHSDRYLDSIDRANGLLDLQKNYIDAINKTTDPKMQQKLAELEEKQLDALSQKEHLREIDLKLAQQQLTVLQAQMALEDAQQAKTKLRLRRDSQGNYTYQYVADEDNIAEKTQEYTKALNEYRTMANESLHQDLEDLRDYTLEYYDALQEAQMKYGDNTEALLEEQNRLYDMYFGDPDGYVTALHNDALSSMNDAQEAMFANLYGLNNTLSEDLFAKFLGPDSEMLTAAKDVLGAGGEVPSLIDAFINDTAKTAFENIQDATYQTLKGSEGLLPEWDSVLWTLADEYDTMFVPRVVEAMNYLGESNQAYVNGLAVMQEASNRTFENIALGLIYDTEYTNALNDATAELLNTQNAQVESAERVYEALKKNEYAFQNQTTAAIDAANAMYLYYLSLNGMAASELPYSVSGSKGGIKVAGTNASKPSSNSSTDTGYSNSSNAPQSTTQSSNTGSRQPQQPWNGNSWMDWWQNTFGNGTRMATGGYTGDWGSTDPRLAWLDTKELVLKESDTANILKAVDIVRNIADRVQATAMSAAAGISNGSSLDLVAAAGETILQNVVINADFPAVQDAAQIKQAFNELVNLASQRASGNRRTY